VVEVRLLILWEWRELVVVELEPIQRQMARLALLIQVAAVVVDLGMLAQLFQGQAVVV
jgi:hypothetical protein